MPRPADGLCHRCHRPLPPECLRTALTRDTDVCEKDARAILSALESRILARRWLGAWADRHYRAMEAQLRPCMR